MAYGTKYTRFNPVIPDHPFAGNHLKGYKPGRTSASFSAFLSGRGRPPPFAAKAGYMEPL